VIVHFCLRFIPSPVLSLLRTDYHLAAGIGVARDRDWRAPGAQTPRLCFWRAVVTDLDEAAQLLDVVEGVLNEGAGHGPEFVAGLLGFGARAARGHALLKPRAHAPFFEPGIGIQAAKRPWCTVSLPCSGFGNCVTSASRTLVVVAVWTIPLALVPIWTFMSKYQWLPFLVWLISGSCSRSSFLVEGGALMMVASIKVQSLSSRRFSSRSLRTALKIASVSRCRSRSLRKLRIVVSSGTAWSPGSIPQKRRIDSMS